MLVNHQREKGPRRPVTSVVREAAPAYLVFCISASRGRADSILVDLLDDGIAGADIAILFRDPDRSDDLPASGIAVPASAGAIRGVIGFLPGVRRVVIPGIGPVILNGGLAAAFDVSAAGGLSQVFQYFGVPAAESVRFAERIAAGHFFIAVRTGHSGTGDRAREIFLAGKADEICTKTDIVRAGNKALPDAGQARANPIDRRGRGPERPAMPKGRRIRDSDSTVE